MVLREEPYHKEIISDIVNKTGIDRRVVEHVATWPFLFIARGIRNIKELRPFMLRYFGKFAIYTGKKREALKKLTTKAINQNIQHT